MRKINTTGSITEDLKVYRKKSIWNEGWDERSKSPPLAVSAVIIVLSCLVAGGLFYLVIR